MQGVQAGYIGMLRPRLSKLLSRTFRHRGGPHKECRLAVHRQKSHINCRPTSQIRYVLCYCRPTLRQLLSTRSHPLVVEQNLIRGLRQLKAVHTARQD